MKQILAIYTLLLVSTTAFADVLANPRDQYLEQRYQQQYTPPPAPQGNVTDMLFNIFLEQGILGAMLIVLGVYFYKMEGQARQDRLKLQEKFESLVTRNQDNLIEVKTHLASLDARMQNLERETEGMKDFIFTRFKV